MIRMGGIEDVEVEGQPRRRPRTTSTPSGADALRLFHLFVGPPQDDVDWDDAGIEGCVAVPAPAVAAGRAVVGRGAGPRPATPSDAVDRAAHRLIVRVTDEFERWSYNTAVAAFMEFTNLLYKQGLAPPFAIDTLLLLLAPMAPHITAELWARRHDGEHIHEQPWPVADPALAAVDTVTMVVQVNGKVRERVEVPTGISAADAERASAAGSGRRSSTSDACRGSSSASRKLVNFVTKA